MNTKPELCPQKQFKLPFIFLKYFRIISTVFPLHEIYNFLFTEPNLLSHTAHSVSKKGVKRRDLNESELRDILAELLPLVRIDHVIPYNSDVLTSAIKRSLLSNPPSHMMSDEGASSYSAAAWVRGKNSGMYLRPRLFTPYYEEAKVGVFEQVYF